MVTPQVYDLREQPWIPVRRGADRRLVGLCDLLLQAHDLSDVEVPVPPATAGLWRILYLLAARVSGLDDPTLEVAEFDDRRCEVLDAGRFDEGEVEGYFARYADRFDLFDPARPWLQDPRLATQCAATSGVNKLVLGRPAGSNQVFFDHHTETVVAPVPAHEAVWHLIARLYFGPSGRCTTRTVGSVAKADTMAGPLRGSLSFHPIGRNLFESLVAGIPAPADGEGYAAASALDAAPWEMAELPPPTKSPPLLRGLGRRLTGRFQHALLLTPSADGTCVVDARLTWAFRDKQLPDRDPYLIYQTSQKGDPYARPARLERALWRDLDALLMNDIGEAPRWKPAVFDLLPEDLVEVLRVRAYGFDQDGQTRDQQFFTALTPSVLGWAEGRPGSRAVGVSATRAAAEQVRRSLVRALKLAWARQSDPTDGTGSTPRADGPPGPWVAAAEARYWPGAERLFWQAIQDGEFTDPSRPFVQLALRIYDGIAGEITSPAHWRMTRALALHRRQIRGFAVAADTAAARGGRSEDAA
ncbi:MULTISPECIES: type I-E CRISPR-associated protein Cse1/CasA [unclassified Frankia]